MPIIASVTGPVINNDVIAVTTKPLYKAPIMFLLFPNLTNQVPIIDVIMHALQWRVDKSLNYNLEEKILRLNHCRNYCHCISFKQICSHTCTVSSLSPTLSAITAGFLGSSSLFPASTFPTKSVRRHSFSKNSSSNLAKIEINEAPKPKATNALIISRYLRQGLLNDIINRYS